VSLSEFCHVFILLFEIKIRCTDVAPVLSSRFALAASRVSRSTHAIIVAFPNRPGATFLEALVAVALDA